MSMMDVHKFKKVQLGIQWKEYHIPTGKFSRNE